MKRRYRFTHGFCLVAYLWTATGLSQATCVSTLINTHARASVLLETAPDDEWFLHHVGHRDAHEPNAIDHERHAATSSTACSDSRADHVMKFDGNAQASAPIAKDFKSPKLPLASLLVATAFVDQPVPPHLSIPDATAQVGSRNTSLAFVKLTQLRL